MFSQTYLERWAFDLELLYVGLSYYATPVEEVAINWHEVDGSKLSVVQASLEMGRDLARIRALYTLGVWRVDAAISDDAAAKLIQ